MQLFGPDKNKLELLKNYKDYCIESVLSTGDKTLSILHPAHLSKNIVEEGYIQNKTNEYVIKEIATQGDWKRVKAKLNVEDLEGKVFESFETVSETITDCINLALAGTGWTVGSCNVTKRRTVRKTNSSSWDIIQEAKKVYRCELEFETLKKKINVYEKRGSDKGVYFIDTLNLKSLDVQSDSYDYYTRIIAKGKGDLKVTLENFQYSNKIKTYIWKDERYTDIDSLTEDATAKLNDLSQPYRSYNATIIDLANISKNYKNILSYSLGDIVTLVSKENNIKEKQRIVKIVEYPDEPYRNTCEMANTALTFEDIQKDFKETSSTVSNITTDDGTIDGSAISGISTEQIYDFEASVAKITDLTIVNAKIEELYAQKANVSELNTVVANVAELFATKATITELNALSANINSALIGKADITELNAINVNIKVLEADTAIIKTLVNGNLSSEHIQTGGITGSNLNMETIFVKDANILSVSASKLVAGQIDTSKITISSADGGMRLIGSTQQFFDENNRVRIQLGKDAQGNFDFYILSENGDILFNTRGITGNAIETGLIKENMLSDGAIGGKKINWQSFTTEFNKDTNTNKLNSSKVLLDGTNQTLDLHFNSLKSTVNNNVSKTESNTTQLNIHQGKIDTLIQDTIIVKDGQNIKLKDDYNRTVTTVNSINSTIGTHTTKINELTGNIESVDTKVNKVERDLEGTKSTISSHETQLNDLNTTVKDKVAIIEANLDSIAQRVSSTETSTTQLSIKVNNSVKTVDVYYAISDSSTTAPTSGWSTNPPTWVNGKYIWSKTTTILTNGTSTTTTPVCITGAKGANGSNGAAGKGVKSIVEQYYLSTSNTTQSGGSWVTTPPAWANGKYMWTRSVITYTDNSTTTTNPVCVSGSKGDTGATGATGATGQGVQSITEEYYLSTSKTSQAGGSWTTTPPAWSKGKYIWTRSKIVYKNPTATAYTTPICDSSWEAANDVDVKVEQTKTQVATLQTNLNSITQKVSTTESNITSINGNITSLQNRVNTAESKLTDKSLTTTISSAINNGNSISTTQFVMDKTGFTVNNGGIRVKNKSGTVVLEGDTNGNLIMKNGCFKVLSSSNSEIASINQNNWMRLQGLELFGAGECMQNKGSGVRSLKLISTDGKASHIDFNENASVTYTVRLIREANSKSLTVLGNGMTMMPNTANTPCGLEMRSQANVAYIDFTSNQSDDYHARVYIKNNDKNLYIAGSGLTVEGNLKVNGSKNCLQKTKNYGERLINAYETTECYYGDLGFGKINTEGECLIFIDDIFQECVNTKVDYHVFTQAYNGAITSIERYTNYFIIKGIPDTQFSWEIKAKRLKYENVRLDTIEIDEFTVDGLKTFRNEDLLIETAEESLLNTLTFDLENILMEG